MLTKLAFRNMSRSVRDYGVYFLTLLLGVSIFYMFNSIYAQQEIMVVTETINESMVALRQILSIFSVFVAVILGGLIVYANHFFIKRRKKELGIYMTLGMEKSEISTILLLETSLMAIVALALGLVLGVFGSQFMSFFTATIFEADMSGFRFVFSPEALIKSIVYFAIIFVIVAIFNIVILRKYKLIDLIHGSRKNENVKIRNTRTSLIISILAVTCLIAAYVLILKNGIININWIFFLSLVLGTVGTVLFFLSFASFVTLLVQSNKNIYLKNLNMFVTRQLSSKINTNFLSISVVCIVLLLVIGIFSTGYSMQNVVSTSLKENVSYDFSLVSDDKNNDGIYENLPDELKEIGFDYSELKIYHSGKDLHYSDLPLDYSDFPFDIAKQPLSFILQSDYNAAMKMQKKDTINLGTNEYGLVAVMESYEDLAREMIKKELALSLEGRNFYPQKNIHKAQLSNTEFASLTIILPDVCKEYLEKSSTNSTFYLNINSKNGEQEKLLDEKINEAWYNEKSPFYYFVSRNEVYTSSVTTKAIVSFLAIYLGVVFMVCCAAILALQQLSEAADNKDRYALLHKLGSERTMINRALFTQILCYFLFPLILAIIHSVVGLIATNDVLKTFGKIDVNASIAVTAVVIVVVYGAYFILTYLGSKSIVNKA